MTESIYSRTQMLIGDEAVARLKTARVLVCGLGGVGGYALEALARAGVGSIDVLDNDVFSSSNLNRQLLSSVHSIGKKKTETAKARVSEINPDCCVNTLDIFYALDTADKVPLGEYDYIIDAIDTVSSKLELICRASMQNVPIISSMGTGNKLGTAFEIADICKTTVCPLARVMRRELKARGIGHLKVVYSKEQPLTPSEETSQNGRHIPASISYAPAIAGLMLAAEVIRTIARV